MVELMGGTARRLFGIGLTTDAPGLSGHAPTMPVEVPAFRRAGELLAAAVQVEFANGESGEVFDLACAALDVLDTNERSRDAELLQGTIRAGHALLLRDAAEGAGDELGANGFMSWSDTRRRAVELLICSLAHLATPALPIPGIDRVGWYDPAPFV